MWLLQIMVLDTSDTHTHVRDKLLNIYCLEQSANVYCLFVLEPGENIWLPWSSPNNYPATLTQSLANQY